MFELHQIIHIDCTQPCVGACRSAWAQVVHKLLNHLQLDLRFFGTAGNEIVSPHSVRYAKQTSSAWCPFSNPHLLQTVRSPDEIEFDLSERIETIPLIYVNALSAAQAGIPFFSSTDTSICNPGFSTGTTTGIGPGEAVINAAWTADAWFMNLNQVCDYSPEDVLREAICQIVDCLCVGTPLTDAEWNSLHSDFPNLQRCQARKQAAATSTYNCLAWTIDDTSRWWWFEADANGDNKISVSELNPFYSSKGKSNITYYGNSTSDVLHVAKKAGGAGTGCPASSKLGMEIRLAHDLEQLEGGVYSNIVGGN